MRSLECMDIAKSNCCEIEGGEKGFTLNAPVKARLMPLNSLTIRIPFLRRRFFLVDFLVDFFLVGFFGRFFDQSHAVHRPS